MNDMLHDMLATMPPEEVNRRFISLGDQLMSLPDVGPMASLLPPDMGRDLGPQWQRSSLRGNMTTLFPAASAITLTRILDRLSGSGMVPAPGDDGPVDPPWGRPRPRDEEPLRGSGHGLLPWALLTDPVALSVMGPDVLPLVGLTEPTAADDVVLKLGLDHPSAPVSLLARTPTAVDAISTMTSQNGPDIPGRDDTETRPGSTTTTTTSPQNPLSEATQKLIDAVVDGFRHASFETYWWGYRIAFPPSFCQAFPALVTGAEGPLALKALIAFVGTSGFWAGISAAAVAVGGWVTAALLLYGLYLAASVALNATFKGVYVCGIWETVVPLWAQGR